MSDPLRLTITSSGVLIGNTTTVVVAVNPNRKFLLLINDSDTDIYGAFGTAAVPHAGFLIKANGGGLILDSGGVTQQAVNAITLSGSNKMLLVNQGV